MIVSSSASTRMAQISDGLYADLEHHFDRPQIMELCFEVGLANLVDRLHATYPIADAADEGWQRSTGS